MATQQGRVYLNTADLRRFTRAVMTERDVHTIKALEKLAEGRVTYASLYSFLRGSARTVEERTLVAVSWALEVTLDELTALTGENGHENTWVWPTTFNELEPQYRIAVERLAGHLLRIQRGTLKDS